MQSNNPTDEEITKAVAENGTYVAINQDLGKSKNGGWYRWIKSHIKRLNLSTDHFLNNSQRTKLGWKNTKYVAKKKVSDEEIFSINSTFVSGSTLKKRFIAKTNCEVKCANCNIEKWDNKPLVFELDHINGDSLDNRIENLRLLCPNCHSQTETYCGRNLKNRIEKKVYACEDCDKIVLKGSKRCAACASKERSNRPNSKYPNINTLIIECETLGWTAVGKKYGLTGNAVKRHVLKNNPQVKSKFAKKS